MSPLSLLGPGILLSLSIPLFLLASITTFAACVTLLVRVGMVYFDLGTAILRSWLFGISKSAASGQLNLEEFYRKQQAETEARLRNARSRASGSRNAFRFQHATATPTSTRIPRSSTTSAQATKPSRRHASTTSLVAFTPQTQQRDFEGVGGWRVLGSDEDQDDAIWMGLNSRLELPTPGAGVLPSTPGIGTSSVIRSGPSSIYAATPHVSGHSTPRPQSRSRKHVRSLTSQSQRFTRTPEPVQSPAQMRMSPVQSRRGSLPGSSASPAPSSSVAAAPSTTSPEMRMTSLNATGDVNDSKAHPQAESSYFTMASPQGLQMDLMSPEEVATESRMEKRRKSISATSTGSAGSVGSVVFAAPASGVVLEGSSEPIS